MAKEVIYYCPGCRKRISRSVQRATATYESFCATAGRAIQMRKIKDQREALRRFTLDNFRL